MHLQSTSRSGRLQKHSEIKSQLKKLQRKGAPVLLENLSSRRQWICAPGGIIPLLQTAKYPTFSRTSSSVPLCLTGESISAPENRKTVSGSLYLQLLAILSHLRVGGRDTKIDLAWTNRCCCCENWSDVNFDVDKLKATTDPRAVEAVLMAVHLSGVRLRRLRIWHGGWLWYSLKSGREFKAATKSILSGLTELRLGALPQCRKLDDAYINEVANLLTCAVQLKRLTLALPACAGWRGEGRKERRYFERVLELAFPDLEEFGLHGAPLEASPEQVFGDRHAKLRHLSLDSCEFPARVPYDDPLRECMADEVGLSEVAISRYLKANTQIQTVPMSNTVFQEEEA